MPERDILYLDHLQLCGKLSLPWSLTLRAVHFARTISLCFPFYSRNKHRLFHNAAIKVWFLYCSCLAFTVRYVSFWATGHVPAGCHDIQAQSEGTGCLLRWWVTLLSVNSVLDIRFLLSVFAELRKATVKLRHVCLRAHGTTRLPLDRFSWNLVFGFSKICPENFNFLKKSDIGSHWTDFQEIWYSSFPENMLRKF